MSEYVGKQIEAFAKMIGSELSETHRQIAKEIAGLRADAEYNRTTINLVGTELDAVKATVAALKREHELAAKLETQRNKRRVETLEVALLAAGRNPAERDDVEAELPDFREWRGHAQ